MSDEKNEPRCHKCQAHLWTDIEREFKQCNRCLDREATREQERREWIYYHQ